MKSVPHKGNGAELEAAHSEVMERPGADNRTKVQASHVPSIPTPSPRRSARQNRGTVPKMFDGFKMN